MKTRLTDKTEIIVVLCCALVFFIVGCVFLARAFSFKKYGEKTNAVITRIEESYDSDGDTDYTVYVSYSVKGVKYENVRLNTYTSGMREGKTIPILYMRDNPSDIDYFKTSFSMPIIFLGISLGLTVISAFSLIKNRMYLKGALKNENVAAANEIAAGSGNCGKQSMNGIRTVRGDDFQRK